MKLEYHLIQSVKAKFLTDAHAKLKTSVGLLLSFTTQRNILENDEINSLFKAPAFLFIRFEIHYYMFTRNA